MDRFKEPIMITKPFLPPINEYKEKIEEIWGNNWLTNQGPLHEEFNKKVREYLKVKNSTLFVNGHLALEMAIKALNLKGEVITTPFTFVSTTHAIKRNGLKPIFCDINKEDYTIDVDKIEALINENTTAIVPVHVYGTPCDVKKINEIAKKYNLKVIYDAAHVFGVEIDGKGIGEFGDVSMFSMHATKVFNSIEGGVLTYNNEEYKNRFDIYKNFGINGPDNISDIGINAKMNEFQAAMGLVNLNYVEDQISKRKKISEIYKEGLKGVNGIKYLKGKENVKHNYAYFPIVIDEKEYGLNRDELHDKLKDYKIFTRKYFYPLINDVECYRNENDSSNTPVAKYISDRILTLPMYGDLAIQDVEKICSIILHLKE